MTAAVCALASEPFYLQNYTSELDWSFHVPEKNHLFEFMHLDPFFFNNVKNALIFGLFVFSSLMD